MVSTTQSRIIPALRTTQANAVMMYLFPIDVWLVFRSQPMNPRGYFQLSESCERIARSSSLRAISCVTTGWLAVT